MSWPFTLNNVLELLFISYCIKPNFFKFRTMTKTNSLILISIILLNKYFLISAVTAGAGITPIPMEMLNPRLTEFRRMDANNDDQISFSEFLLSDRPWMETLSRRYHQLDGNSDGRVSRKEFETFFKSRDDAADKERSQADNFFKQLGTGIFPPPSITSPTGPIQSTQSGESLLPASSLIRDHEQQFRLISEGAAPFSQLIASSQHSPLYNLREEFCLINLLNC
uniref:EF-hand domain-containing protein n=1 Tax=Meloidogyne enterolobii TaxID=390850 RepID=A0A6V7VIK6_MELEN|nr:unnamed protein product [Meloidogyne enterolobii]